jgi:hypothetical protein
VPCLHIRCLRCIASLPSKVSPVLQSGHVAIDLPRRSFLAPLTSRDRRQNAVLRSLGDLRTASRQWALEAGRTALQHMDQPTLYMIQTCQMLSLYWFSQGDSRRNDMFSGWVESFQLR